VEYPRRAEQPVAEFPKAAEQPAVAALKIPPAVVELPSEHAARLVMKGVSLHVRGNVDEAIVELEEAVALNDGNDDTHTALAAAYFDTDQIEPAREQVQRAIAINPNNGDARVMLGIVSQMTGDIPNARTAYVRYLDQWPTDVFADDVRLLLQALPD